MSPDAIKTIIDQATAAQGFHQVPDGYPLAIVPEGYKLESLESFQATPYRKRGNVAFHQALSFGRYVSNQDQRDTALFCDRSAASFEAVLDYHSIGDRTPGWREHRAIFQMTPTEEWATWERYNVKSLTQVQFGEFLEQNLPDISHPDGASLLEVALQLEEKRAVTFRSAVRLGDGMRQFRYEEEKAGGAGALTVPENFELSLAPYEGSEKRRVDARLRYRIKEGELTFFYQLIRPRDAQLAAIDEAQKVIEKVTALVCYMGKAGIGSGVAPF